MEEHRAEIGGYYQTQFDPKNYLNDYYETITEDFRKIAIKLNEIFHSGKIKGKSYLDFGCGPNVVWFVPASFKFDDITTCEYLSKNRESVWKWLNNDKDALDWSAYIELFAQLEGKNKTELENRVRNSVRRVIPCDIYNDNPIHPEEAVFDVVFTSLCLEGAATKREFFDLEIRNLSSLLKPGGTLIEVGILGCSQYHVGPNLLPCLNLDEKLIKDTLKENGFSDIDFHLIPRIDFTQPFQYDGYFTLTAHKKA